MILVDVPHAAALLGEVRQTGRTIPELPDGLRPGSAEEAYAIQDAVVDSQGWDIGCLKVGCTSDVAQQALGIDEPIAGRLAKTVMFTGSTAVPRSLFLHDTPYVECEFAMRLGRSIGVDDDVSEMAEVAEVVDALAPAIELVDSRFDQFFGVSGYSIVADNSAAAAVVIGQPVAPDSVTDLAEIGVKLLSEDQALAAGTGAAVLGDPYRALRWVLGHERRRGRGVPAGTWVITGTCTGLVPLPQSGALTASFDDPLGSLQITTG